MKQPFSRFCRLTGTEHFGETVLRQCLVGSLNGAFSSKRVTEEFIKVGLARMEIGQDVQTQKPA